MGRDLPGSVHPRDRPRHQLRRRRPARRARPEHALNRRALAAAFAFALSLGPARTTAAPPPPCTRDQLALFPFSHSAYGRQLPGIGLRNISLQACTIVGYPRVTLFDLGGKPGRAAVIRKPFLDTRPIVYVVAPSQGVFFALYGEPLVGRDYAACEQYASARITLPGQSAGTTIPLSTGTCGRHLSVSQIFPIAELAS